MKNIKNISKTTSGEKEVFYNNKLKSIKELYRLDVPKDFFIFHKIQEVAEHFIQKRNFEKFPEWIFDKSNYEKNESFGFAFYYHGDGDYRTLVKGPYECLDYYNPDKSHGEDNHAHIKYFDTLSDFFNLSSYYTDKIYCSNFKFIEISPNEREITFIKSQIKDIAEELSFYADVRIDSVWKYVELLNDLKKEYEKLK